MKMKPNEFVVYVDYKAWAKFRYWISLSGSDEVSALGIIEELQENGTTTGLLVSEIYLLTQVVNGVETIIDDKAVADLMIDLASRNIDCAKLKCWIHSHANMKTFWSSTDHKCCELLANGSYSVSIVTNSRDEILTRIDVYKPCHMVLDRVATQIYFPQDGELKEQLEAEFKAKVKKDKTPQIPKEKMIPVSEFESEEELEEALNQGVINFHEYEMLTRQSMFEDF